MIFDVIFGSYGLKATLKVDQKTVLILPVTLSHNPFTIIIIPKYNSLKNILNITCAIHKITSICFGIYINTF